LDKWGKVVRKPSKTIKQIDANQLPPLLIFQENTKENLDLTTAQMWWYSSLSFCWTADTPEDMRLRPEVERRFRRVYY
jgi:hypothetical protein